MKRLPISVGLFTVAAILVVQTLTASQSGVIKLAVPRFAVDPSWPKPLPNGWSLGPVSGVAVDRRDHVWLVHRVDPVKQAGGTPAPPVVEIDQNGAVGRAWGGAASGYEWPEQVHGITVDGNDRVWITGNGERDAQILAFTQDGTFLRQIGRSGQSRGSQDTNNFGHPTQVRLDPGTRELFVADGENKNHRVAVFEAESGAYKRHWGAYGKPPDDAAASTSTDSRTSSLAQFGYAVHCVRLARDGTVYVCDRNNNRFQLFRKSGEFLKEVFIEKGSPGGTVWDIDFSPDQQFMYVADGTNQTVWILRREQLDIIGSFGRRGPGPGEFLTSLHDIAVDSKGNIYTGEAATGGRIQRFLWGP